MYGCNNLHALNSGANINNGGKPIIKSVIKFALKYAVNIYLILIVDVLFSLISPLQI